VVGVSFGAVGTPIVAQIAATGLTGLELARATGIYHSLLGWLPLGVMLVLVGRTAPGAERGRSIWGWAALAYLCFTVPYTLIWHFVGAELPTLAGALFGGIAFVLLLGRFDRGRRDRERRHRGSRDAAARAHSLGEVLRAAAPYLALVLLVLCTRLVTPVQRALQSLELRWELWGLFAGGMQPLYHPGTMLLLGFVTGALLQRAPRHAVTGAIGDATRRLVPVAIALAAMLLLSRIMVHAGMTEALATVAAETAGRGWPVFAPFVGALGTFVTGSATASNILFTDFQRETASTLGLSVAGLAGAQGFGAAVGNMICPHNVVAAGATVGLEGREGEILRATLWVALAYTGLGALLALWLVR
jgi:lactate permease